MEGDSRVSGEGIAPVVEADAGTGKMGYWRYRFETVEMKVLEVVHEEGGPGPEYLVWVSQVT